MKRRDFLKLTGASVPAIGLTACHDDSDTVTETDDVSGTPTTPAAPSYSANDIRSSQAARIVSADGELNYDMNLEYAQFDVNGIGLNNRTFNGKFPPDTLVAKPGDTLKVKFKNSLPPSAEDHFHPHNINVPHGFNNANLHTHGLNVSPASNEDNILLVVHPGESFDYEIHIPEDHPSGTFWYHPHKHGSALHQLASGMAGFLMIEGGDDDLKKIPEIAAAEEVDLSFHEMIIGITADNLGTVPAEGVPGQELVEDPDDPSYNPYARNPIYSLFSQQAYLQYTLNGKAIDAGAKPATETSAAVAGTPPEITLRPGEVQRWNLGLLCHLQTYRLAIHNDDATAAGIPLRVAAWDGVTADQLESHDELVLGPADRVDLLIKAPTTPGTYHLKMLYEQFGNSGVLDDGSHANEFPVAFDENGIPIFWLPAFTTPSVGATELNMLTIKVEGDVNEMALPASLNPPTKRLPYILDHEITRHRTIEFKVTGQVGIDFSPDAPFLITDNRKFFVNNIHFSGNRINETMLLGTAEEWTITNIHEGEHQFLQINHPFHIHVNWFQVMEIHHPAKDGHDAYVEKPNNGRGRWVDTIDVPFGGKTIIRHRFENYTGIFPLHCHVIAHEDEGMMHLCEVIDPTPVSETILNAGGGTLMSTEKRAFSTEADDNGLLTVQDGDARVKVAFPAGAFDQDALITYAYQLDPEAAPGNGAGGEELIGLERYFDLYSPDSATLNADATVTIDIPSELSHGQTYDEDTVQLYRYDEVQSAWTTDGIAQVSKDDGLLVSTINNTAFKSEYFAVLATQLTGPVTTPTTSGGDHGSHG